MQSNNITIGGGLSGLIWGLYNPSFQIITPVISRHFDNLYLVRLHDTPEVRKLLKDLGWKNPEKSQKCIQIGFYKNGLIHNEFTKEMRLDIIQKKMTNWNEKIDKTFIPKSFNMSTAKTDSFKYCVLDVNLNEVLKKLLENQKHLQRNAFVRIITDEHILITNEKNEDIKNATILSYSKLVSTIAAPVFWSIFRGNNQQNGIVEFKSKPVTNVITKNRPFEFDEKFETIYFDENKPFSRLSKMGNKYVYEFTGFISKKQVKEILPTTGVDDYVVVPNGRIYETHKNNPPNENITFLGRFAEWKYGIVVEDVIKKTINLQ